MEAQGIHKDTPGINKEGISREGISKETRGGHPQGNPGHQQGNTQYSDFRDTTPSRNQASTHMQNLIANQRRQKRDRKNARVNNHLLLGHELQGRPSAQQQEEALNQIRLPSGDRPEVKMTVDPRLKGSGAGNGQQRIREGEERAQERWYNERPATGSAARYTPQEQNDLMRAAKKQELYNTQQRIDRSGVYSPYGNKPL
ncbi:MAG: hypothetical protein Q9195_005510 [Heterodermia aff. obscurata]